MTAILLPQRSRAKLARHEPRQNFSAPRYRRRFFRSAVVNGTPAAAVRVRRGTGDEYLSLCAKRRPLSSKAMATTLPRFAMARATKFDSSCTNAANRFRLRFSPRRGIVLRRRSRRWYSPAQSTALLRRWCAHLRRPVRRYPVGAYRSTRPARIQEQSGPCRRDLDSKNHRRPAGELERRRVVDLSLLLQRRCSTRTGLRSIRTEVSRNFGAISAAEHPLLLDRAVSGFKKHHTRPRTAHRQEDQATAAPVGQLSGQRPVHARRVTYRPTHRPRSTLAGCSLQLSEQSVAAGRVEFYPVGNML